MKALFIAYNQAYNEEIVDVLKANGQRGFTRWENVEGKGSFNGVPHFGNHAWPELNHAVLVVVKDEKVAPIIAELKAKDAEAPDLGLRVFSWQIEEY